MGPFVVNTRLLFVCMLFLGVMVWGGVIWDFDDAATPEGASLRLIEGKPAFTRVDGGQGLAPGVGLAWADAGVLRLRPELELHCRFRLDALRETTQNLALKDGEYLLRVDWQKEGGHLSFFVHLEGKWEPRLRGPVVKPGVWYDVHAQWTGTALRLNVNGELYTRQRSGPTREGDAPLETGPVTGVIDRLGLWNPSYDRSALLWAFDAKAAQAVRQPTQEFVGESGWDDWEALGGARCETEDGVLSASFPSASTMLVSPPLVCELSPLPFICIDVDASGGGWSGHLDVVTDRGRSGDRPASLTGRRSQP